MHARTVFAASLLCLAVAATAAADIEIHQNHRFDARPGATVVVDVSFHSVDVTAVPGDSVDVKVDVVVKGDGSSAKNAANELQPKFLVEGDKLIIRSTLKKGWSWKSVSAKGMITIAMPPGVNLSVDASSGGTRLSGDFGDAVVEFDASSGSLTLDGAARELHADISSGSVRAVVMRPLESFSADASSGSVHLTGGAHEAHVDTSSGSIELTGLLGDGFFDSSSGSINAQWKSIPPGAKVRAGASSGNVTLGFPSGTQLEGSVDVSSGGIHSDFPGTTSKNHMKLTGGPGAVGIAVETSSGSVKLVSN
jgi:DUF4097 and DUF4098 domain-containing protein YvlB